LLRWCWAQSTQQRGLLEKGDVESALGAARQSATIISKDGHWPRQPETFTHGTSQQRMHWFNAGLDGGTISACNTFDQSQ